MRNEDFKHYSKELGWLDIAGAEVWQEFVPANDKSRAKVEAFVVHLGLRFKNLEKKVMCISDFLMAAKHSSNGLICIPMDANHYRGAAYGYKIAVAGKEALEEHGFIQLHQPAHKKEGLCALYRTNFPDDLLDCRFKWHGKGRPVEVRSGRRLDEHGNSIGGQKLGLKPFEGKIKPLAADVMTLRAHMLRYPVQDENGREYGGLRRIFHNGRLDKGGRFYGSWQQLSEDDRLKLKIGGKKGAEIDLKAAFPNIIAATKGAPLLDFDPYISIEFVRVCNDPAEQKKARKLAKLLCAAYVSNGGRTSRFPRGKKRRGTDGRRHVVSVREQFNLPKSARATDYYADIERAFPFLVNGKLDVFDLMFIESEIMKEVMLELAGKDIPSLPVHDCLMCREEDVDLVVDVLQAVMRGKLGRSIAMDVTFSSGEVREIDGYLAGEGGKVVIQKSYPQFDWGLADDFDVVEDD